ncbi:cobyrinate a,c-diamide synthase [Rhodoferax sp. TBRC 17198]|uniref:cobyrinate a,c-diamide synthase n=1 Tax=Rhodoferax potami TaxID=3068338 RepID=UPI0028BE9EE8|nr:cobyrinate a,c-diamide synthase [Rhodoferax sp. TBRC 17198]MDT7521865.1 cobyrinate a,c-diamide synthase [Rhodoferax sp. TBRC 17198]
MSRSCPALLITAPSSGQGKTTVTSALARLHTRQGRRVRVFKCGPDFLDPYWHQLASGAPVYQLDLWMTGEDDCRQRLSRAAEEADLILVEGVMGLFDGDPSAADLAQRFGLHVMAVMDSGSMAGTFGALAYGLQTFRPGLRWAGALANRVATERHAAMLQRSLRSDSPWLGAVMRNAAMTLPERHLGLTVASEVADAQARLDAAADALAATPLGQMSVEDLQQWSVEFQDQVSELEPARQGEAAERSAQVKEEPAKRAGDTEQSALPLRSSLQESRNQKTASPNLKGKTIAVARDTAFCFIYTANLDCLQSLGAELVFFSPLKDTALPTCDAVWIPGGYPELHANTLSANTRLRDSLAAHVQAGKPVWAECGGMMVLFDTITTTDGAQHTLWGLLPGEVTMHKRLSALGPQQLKLQTGTLRGHTFHYSTSASTLVPVARTARPDHDPMPDAGEAVWQQGSVRASYFHAWFPSCPEAVVELFTPAHEGPA